MDKRFFSTNDIFGFSRGGVRFHAAGTAGQRTQRDIYDSLVLSS